MNDEHKSLFARVGETHYTTQEVLDLFGVTRDSFENMVRQGLLHRVTFTGKRGWGYYRKAEVHALQARIEAQLHTSALHDIQTLLTQMQEACQRIDITLLGVDATPLSDEGERILQESGFIRQEEGTYHKDIQPSS